MYVYIYIYTYIYIHIYMYIGAMKMFDLYIMYIFIGAKVNHTSSKNAG